MEDLEITREEAETLEKALKQEEFQKLLVEYFEEVNDPENKKKYQEEVTQFEKERGYDVTFINPESGYVIKTSVNGEKKAFINICKCDKLEPPSGDRQAGGKNWSIPYSLLKPREDLDKNGKRCLVYDVVFHPKTHQLAEDNVQFRNVVNETALDAIENNLNVKLDRKNLKYPKLSYKGVPVPSVIRRKSETPPVQTEDGFDLSSFAPPVNKCWYSQNTNSKSEDRTPPCTEKDNVYTVPKYSIIHRSAVDIQNHTNDRFAPFTVSLPKELVIEINLPLLSSTETVILDVMEKSISLLCEKPAKYKLDLVLPYTVNEDTGSAKFDKSTRKLTLTLPLKFRRDSSRECDDSGVESDLGTRTPELSSGDDDSTDCRVTPVKEITPFLNPNKHYSFPPFGCDVTENSIKFILKIKNVDPTSVGHVLLSDGACSYVGIHVRFSSMGAGYFPLHYASCIKFPDDVKIQEKSVSVEVLDNYISVELQLDDLFSEYYIGVDEDNLEKKVLSDEPEEEREVQMKQRVLTRTLSESSGDDFSSSPMKGILKRTSRSMSESSVDDLICSSFEMISEEDEGNRNKKSVRFNDVVSQKVYRTNSSILGQRKKNQRKVRNKKKAQENRRASESEASDWEEKEKEVDSNQTIEDTKVNAVADMMFDLDI